MAKKKTGGRPLGSNNYAPDFIAKVLAYYKDEAKNASQCARKFGISSITLERWREANKIPKRFTRATLSKKKHQQLVDDIKRCYKSVRRIMTDEEIAKKYGIKPNTVTVMRSHMIIDDSIHE